MDQLFDKFRFAEARISQKSVHRRRSKKVEGLCQEIILKLSLNLIKLLI
jgi:hypothetical protein